MFLMIVEIVHLYWCFICCYVWCLFYDCL